MQQQRKAMECARLFICGLSMLIIAFNKQR